MLVHLKKGGYIAYTSSRGNSYDIYLYNLSNGAKFQLTNGLADSFSTPVWNGDNSKIAFVGKNRIVYVIYLSIGKIAAIDQIDPENDISLDWSSDNNRLVYTTRNKIYIYDVVTHRSNSISEPDAAGIQWFPSGKEFLYQGIDENRIQQLYRISVNGTGKRQITNNTGGPLHDVKLSPDGTFALYTTPGASISLIRTVQLATGNVYEIAGGELAKNYYPTWSPKSQLIGFSATAYTEQKGYFNELRTVGKRGYNERVIATSSCFATPVTWSPDGSSLAYLSGCTEQQYATEIWIVGIKERTPKLLTRDGVIGALAWSSPLTRSENGIYTNATYGVRFRYPASWDTVDSEKYEGRDGFFQISAISGGEDINEICRGEALHKLMPYGSSPRIIKATIQNREACYIYPSADQPPEMKRQGAVIVRYPAPVEINGATYNYFILWADEKHLYGISSTLVFL